MIPLVPIPITVDDSLQWSHALIDESARQLRCFCAIHIVSFLVLITLKPFANT